MRQWNVLRLESGPATGTAAPQAQAAGGVVSGWNRLARAALDDTANADWLAARLLATLHTCMYNAWAAYDDVARQTVHGVAVRLPHAERGAANKAGAMSHAAHRVLVGRLPAHAARFDAHLRALGLDPAAMAPLLSPAGIGRAQAAAMLDACRADAGAIGTPHADHAAAEQWYRLATRGRHDDERDVLLLFVLANALADASLGAAAPAPGSSLLRCEALPGGADPAAAAAEAWRRMGRPPFIEAALPRAGGLTRGGQEAGRQVGARVFEKARRCWLGRL